MSVKVLTYENPNDFFRAKEFKPYKKYLHICATSSLKKSLQKRGGIEGRVISAKELIDRFYTSWNTPVERFSQFAKLSDNLRRYSDKENENIIKAFKKNKLDILITMRNLTEIGISPNDVKKHTTKIEEVLFCDVWETMVREFEPLMKIAENNLSSNGILRVLNDYTDNSDFNTIILHGFYYISPVQHFVFSKWKEEGINLIFLNLYSEKYPSTFKFLEKNFSLDNGWAKKEDWMKIPTTPAVNAEKFAAKLEGNLLSTTMENIEEKSFDYVIDFINDFLEKDKSLVSNYVSPSHDSLNERVAEYVDKKDTKKHFLSYPIGQYLFRLHSLYSEDEKEYLLNGNTVLEFFTSGWLVKNDINAKNYTYKLREVLPFFSDCISFDEWINRFKHLIDLKKRISQENVDIESNQPHFISTKLNPYLRFSYLSISIEELKLIESFFKKILLDAKRLMEIERERITLKEHFDKIKTLLNESGVKENLVLAEEVALINSLESSLSMFGTEDTFNVVDLAEALNVFLGNGFSQEDNRDTENEIIKPVEQIDGLILETNNKLHLCAMDEKNFPSSTVPMPWPLSKETIKNIDNKSANMYVFREEHQSDISKYLYFTALSYKGPLKISWIKNWKDEVNLGKSLYLHMINKELSEDLKHEFDFRYLEEEAPIQLSGKLNDSRILPLEEQIEAKLCMRRFFYSSIFSKFSTYHQDFHFTFLLGTIVKIEASKGKSDKEIMDSLKGFFPPFSEARIRFIIEENKPFVDAFNMYGMQNREYRETTYKEYAGYFHFLTHRAGFQDENWKQAFNNSSLDNFFETQNFRDKIKGNMLESSPGYLCRYCPHSSYCKDTEYPIDFKEK